MLCSLSNLDQATLKTIQGLEEETGTTLLSFSCQDIQPADLDEAVLAKIQKLEKDLSISLVAVKSA